MVQNQRKDPASSRKSTTMPGRKSHFRQSQVVNTFDQQYQSKLFFNPSQHNASIAPKTLNAMHGRNTEGNLLSSAKGRDGLSSQGTGDRRARGQKDNPGYTLAMTTAVNSQEIQLSMPGDIPTPGTTGPNGRAGGFGTINQSSMESLNQRAPEGEHRLISKSSADLL